VLSILLRMMIIPGMYRHGNEQQDMACKNPITLRNLAWRTFRHMDCKAEMANQNSYLQKQCHVYRAVKGKKKNQP